MGSSPSALEWIEGIVREPEVTLVDAQTARHPLTQAELARRDGLSAGTVQYRVEKLGRVVKDRRGGLVVDLAAMRSMRQQVDGDRLQTSRDLCAALAEAWGRPGPNPGEVQLAVRGWRRPTCADVAGLLQISRSTAQAHLTRLTLEGLLVKTRTSTVLTPLAGVTASEAVAPVGSASGGRSASGPMPQLPRGDVPADLTRTALEVLAQGFEAVHALAEALGALVAGLPTSTIPRTDVAQIARETVAQFAELRDEVSRISIPEETDQTENITTSNENPDLSGPESANSQVRAARRQFADSGSAAPDRAADHPTVGVRRGGPAVGAERVPDLVADLQAVCRELDLPDDLDADGSGWLGLLSEPQITYRVRCMIREIRANPKRYKRPFGALVGWVKKGKADKFPLPPPPPPPPEAVAPVLTQRDVAEAHVNELEADGHRRDELDALDQAVRAARSEHPLTRRTLPGQPRAGPGDVVGHLERVAHIEGLLCRGEKLAPDRHRRPTAVP